MPDIVALLNERMAASEARMRSILAEALYAAPWHLPRFDYVAKPRLRRWLAALWCETRWRVRHAWEALIYGSCENAED